MCHRSTSVQAAQPARSRPALFHAWLSACLLLACSPGLKGAAVPSDEDPLLVLVKQRPAHGLVVARVPEPQVDNSGPTTERPRHWTARCLPGGQPVPAQFVPDPVMPDTVGASGLLLMQLPATGGDVIELQSAPAAPAATAAADQAVVKLRGVTVTHQAGVQGGLPSRITFDTTGRTFSEFNWNDRVHSRQQGGYLLRDDPQSTVRIVADGPLCTVVETRAAYQRPDGQRPASRPAACYRWHYLHDQPLVLVTATSTQDQPARWDELHFLELNFPGRDFQQFLGNGQPQPASLAGDGNTHSFTHWAAVLEADDLIGMFRCGQVNVHDGRGAYGTYLHAAAHRAWTPWESTRETFSGWLWIGNSVTPADELAAWQQDPPDRVPLVVTLGSIRAAITELRREADQATDPEDRRQRRWRVALAEQLEARGARDDVRRVLEGKLPAHWTVLPAGDLRLALKTAPHGVQLASVCDTRTTREFLAAHPEPLFTITLRQVETGQELQLNAADGWENVHIDDAADRRLTIRWSGAQQAEAGSVCVTAEAEADPVTSGVHWNLHVTSPAAPWALWRVVFPQLTLASPGDTPVLLYPRGAGALDHKAWDGAFRFQGTYPNGWTTMQFAAAYDQQQARGLYWGMHDPRAATKDLRIVSQTGSTGVLLAADHPVAGMGRPGSEFTLGGQAVWRLFDGDWFDAAVIYRDWVRHQAAWYPQLGRDGRSDTPQWMRELPVWVMTGGTGRECVERVEKFARFVNLPVGFHWYRWHQIPFDNDYPHYFPANDDFADGVRRLRDANVFVMPYINGRLWDTRDRGIEDFEFTSRALPATTKDIKGQPYIEMYGSKESDDSRVRLAVMCPSTQLWQDQVRAIVTQLFDPCGVAGVYIDQVAAASANLCFDAHHAHPLGGGHWWVDSYGAMLERIRREMPADRMLTTECNAEPYIRWFDGYLTWHWQYDGQVPAFPAVYGGAIQMFGRAYRGGPTKDLALRMKAGQQLVYGEQIGWFDPGVIDDAENGRFIRDVVQLRWDLRRYFFAGEMARPPRLTGDIPAVTADWQWSGTWPVTTSAVQRGVWSLPNEKKVVFLLVNVSDQELQAQWTCSAADYALPDRSLTLASQPVAPSGPEPVDRKFTRELRLPPRSVQAWTLECK